MTPSKHLLLHPECWPLCTILWHVSNQHNAPHTIRYVWCVAWKKCLEEIWLTRWDERNSAEQPLRSTCPFLEKQQILRQKRMPPPQKSCESGRALQSSAGDDITHPGPNKHCQHSEHSRGTTIWKAIYKPLNLGQLEKGTTLLSGLANHGYLVGGFKPSEK